MSFIDRFLNLEVSCAVYNDETKEIKEVNARPDFFIHSTHTPQIIGFREVELSPFVQMVTAGLGYLSLPLTKYLVGMCISKTRNVSLYLMTNTLSMKVVPWGPSDDMFIGQVDLRPLSTDDCSLIDKDKLKLLLEKIESVMDFIRSNYLEIFRF